MKKELIKPNFKKNIINISATLSEYLGNKTEKSTLPLLKEYLKDDYKNIVFIIFDGLGMNPININLDDNSFIKSNIKDVLTSTFPSTTTSATTTLLTGKYPLEHGFLGWSLYFEELNRAVDIYLSSDSYTEENIDPNFISERFDLSPYYKEAITDYTINKVVPSYWHDGIEDNRYVFFEPEEMFDYIKEVISKDGKQFVYAYCPQPDYSMHKEGVSSSEAKEVINKIDELLENIVRESKDTLFIVTADHGQVDIDGYVEFYKDEEINDLLKWPPTLEPRAASFKVKEGKKEQFKKLFEERYGTDFVLFETDKLLKEGYFGDVITDNVKFLGDYIGVGVTNKLLLFSENHTRHKGHHTSLTEEMEVPLIIIKGVRE